jgi:hypothetical protein
LLNPYTKRNQRREGDLQRDHTRYSNIMQAPLTQKKNSENDYFPGDIKYNSYCNKHTCISVALVSKSIWT